MIKTFWSSKCSCDNKLKFIIIVIGVYLNTPLVLCRAKMANHNSAVVYYMDHEISEKSAKLVYKDLKHKLLSNETRPAWCKDCTNDVVAYCLGKKMLDDHCCCDQQHGEDQLSWVPHTCYISHDKCVPYIGSCIGYSDTRLCCCNKLLAEHLYPHGDSSQISKVNTYFYITIFVSLIIYYRIVTILL